MSKVEIPVPSKDPKKKKADEPDAVDGKDAPTKPDQDGKDVDDMVRVQSATAFLSSLLNVSSQRRISSFVTSWKCSWNG
jgi:hypothetical protein